MNQAWFCGYDAAGLQKILAEARYPRFADSGVGGVWIGGVLGEKLGAKDPRWLVWIPAIALIAGLPFGALSLLAPSWPLSLAAFTFPLATHYVYSGPVFGLMQTLMPPNRTCGRLTFGSSGEVGV